MKRVFTDKESVPNDGNLKTSTGTPQNSFISRGICKASQRNGIGFG